MNFAHREGCFFSLFFAHVYEYIGCHPGDIHLGGLFIMSRHAVRELIFLFSRDFNISSHKLAKFACDLIHLVVKVKRSDLYVWMKRNRS